MTLAATVTTPTTRITATATCHHRLGLSTSHCTNRYLGGSVACTPITETGVVTMTTLSTNGCGGSVRVDRVRCVIAVRRIGDGRWSIW
jgi:hypothetical protein